MLWEAQFGDFVNGAQTVIDEFITAGETKWRQQSGVVMLLPHGYEGQGPDHSSARIERFLSMAADEAFVVAQPSTPASYFHLLRQHSLGEDHRPLVVFTPKSMLKRKEAASQPGDFTSGEFRPLITDDQVDTDAVDTLLLCSGRVTWDLMVERGKREDASRFAIGRLERLYPRPTEEIHDYIAALPEPQGGPLGAGRAAQHGAVAALRAQRLAGDRHARRAGDAAGVVVAVGRHRQAAHGGAEGAARPRLRPPGPSGRRQRLLMYFTDRGIEELQKRRGDEEVTLAWLAERLQEFTDTHPEFETAVERLATWLARLDDPED